MTELKKIVVEGYPVERLPEELRRLLGSDAPVRVVLEQEAEAVCPDWPDYGFAKGMYAEQGLAPTQYIRSLRDEWK